ncbi:MAG: hypothetical protein ACKER6_00940, partial [Candidatus Hodgkinia cicadicola]
AQTNKLSKRHKLPNVGKLVYRSADCIRPIWSSHVAMQHSSGLNHLRRTFHMLSSSYADFTLHLPRMGGDLHLFWKGHKHDAR